MPRYNSTLEYMAAQADKPASADNEFGHKALLLDSEKDEKNLEDMPGREFQMKFSQLIDKDIQTSNIGSDQYAFYDIEEAKILTHFLDMASREKSLRGPFILLYNQFRNGLLITKAKNGKWAEQQYRTGTLRAGGQAQGGYGADIAAAAQEQAQAPDQNQNPIAKFMGGLRGNNNQNQR